MSIVIHNLTKALSKYPYNFMYVFCVALVWSNRFILIQINNFDITSQKKQITSSLNFVNHIFFSLIFKINI